MASNLPPAEGDAACVTNTDIENIKKIIQNEIKELANEIKALAEDRVDKTICSDIAKDILLKGEADTGIKRLEKAVNDVACQQSSDTAKDVSLRGTVLQTNTTIKEKIFNVLDNIRQKIKDKFKKHRKKIPSFLFISAPLKLKGSRERKNEEYQRECEAKNFLEEFEMDSDQHRTIKVVDSYAQMLEEIKKFIKDKELSELPFVVFLGHGSACGELCFHEGGWKDCLEALDGVHECFKENKRKEMPSQQLRFVFAQCHGHLVDGKNVPGKIQERGLEYAYITSTAQPLSRSYISQNPPDTSW